MPSAIVTRTQIQFSGAQISYRIWPTLIKIHPPRPTDELHTYTYIYPGTTDATPCVLFVRFRTQNVCNIMILNKIPPAVFSSRPRIQIGSEFL